MDDNSEINNLDIIDLNNNNIEYKGQFGGDDNEDELHFYEYGAHFKYKSLYSKLEEISNAQIENESISTPHNRNASQKPSSINNKYNTNFTIQSRNFNHSNRNVNNNININKDIEKNGISVALERGIKCKNNFTFGTKSNNNNNMNVIITNKKAPALNINKNKNILAKNTIKHINKLDIKTNKNKIHISSNTNNINSQSNSKPKSNNNIKSISTKKQISSIPNTLNNNFISSTKRQTKLSSSYQNLCLNKIISPSKKPITQTVISNIKYKKVNTNPSLNKLHPSINLKSRNAANDTLSHNTKNKCSNNLHNLNIFKKIKKEEDKQSLTYQQTNNDEQIKTSSKKSNSKGKNEIIGIVIKQKPRSQDRPKNVFQTNIIKSNINHISKKNTSSSIVKGNIVGSIRTSIKKGNNVSPLSAKHPKSCNIGQRTQMNQNKQKMLIKKTVINNNITTVGMTLQERLSSSGSKNKNMLSKNNEYNGKSNCANVNMSCVNKVGNKCMRPISNNNKKKNGGKNIGKNGLNIKVRHIKGSCNNSNKKGGVQGNIKTQENVIMKPFYRGGNSNSNKKDKNQNVNILISSGQKIDTEESSPINSNKDK